ncbi:hypothetical protein GE21DRAFT_1136531 [Neurospora crassa]|nr:hypothetical protein GE21DRAFT_1136531 [Neurospora crassa]
MSRSCANLWDSGFSTPIINLASFLSSRLSRPIVRMEVKPFYLQFFAAHQLVMSNVPRKVDSLLVACCLQTITVGILRWVGFLHYD